MGQAWGVDAAQRAQPSRSSWFSLTPPVRTTASPLSAGVRDGQPCPTGRYWWHCPLSYFPHVMVWSVVCVVWRCGVTQACEFHPKNRAEPTRSQKRSRENVESGPRLAAETVTETWTCIRPAGAVPFLLSFREIYWRRS